MDTEYNFTKAEIEENRKNWIAYLRDPKRQKGKHALDIGDGRRCCLGHYCYMTYEKYGVKRAMHNVGTGLEAYYNGRETRLPPKLAASLDISDVGFFRHDVDLSGRAEKPRTHVGDWGADKIDSLAALNDKTDLTPAEIADFIEKGFENDLFYRFGEGDE